MSRKPYVHDVETHNTRAADVVVPLLVERYAPRSVLDVGCGLGTWLEPFADRGCEILGLEGEHVPDELLRVPRSSVRVVDLSGRVASPGRFDLALCLEVAEHLPAEAAPGLVDLLTSSSDVVVFSAAVPGQGGSHHVNEQWPQYWQELFRARGFDIEDELRWTVWDDERVDWWYRQNLMVARRGIGPTAPVRRVVHPRLLAKKEAVIRDFYRGRVPLRTAVLILMRALRRAVSRD